MNGQASSWPPDEPGQPGGRSCFGRDEVQQPDGWAGYADPRHLAGVEEAVSPEVLARWAMELSGRGEALAEWEQELARREARLAARAVAVEAAPEPA